MKNKKELLEALDDSDIQEKILRIIKKSEIFDDNSYISKRKSEPIINAISESEYNELKSKYNTLHGKYVEENKQKLLYIDMVNRLKSEYADIEKKLEEYIRNEKVLKENIEQLSAGALRLTNENTTLSSQVQDYANTFGELKKIYDAYISLSDNIREYLSNVISDKSLVLFLCSGSQWDNIQALWSSIKFQLDNYSEKEIAVLMSTFIWFFEQYNKISKSYVLLDVNNGDTFDGDIHSRSSDSAVSGIISKVLLRGYKNIINGRIIEKSVVRV